VDRLAIDPQGGGNLGDAEELGYPIPTRDF
jgi:hypothetical protein